MSTSARGVHRKRRSWFRRRPILAGLGAVVVIFFGSAAVAGVVEGILHPVTAGAGGSSSPTPRASTPTPATAPVPSPAPTSGPAVVPEAASSAMRGLLGTPSSLDHAYPRLPESACAEQGETKFPIGVLEGWRLGSGGIACYSGIGDGIGPPWNGHIVAFDVYFPRHISEQQARRAVAVLLPNDAQATGPYQGVNNDLSAKPEGSCQVIAYTSPMLANAVRAANPSWTADPSKAAATFYSGRATSENGSEKPFNPDSINEVLVSIGNDGWRGGYYTC